MRPKRCKACDWHWFGSSNACPNCGQPKPARRSAQAQSNPHLKNMLWVAAAVTLLIVLLEMS
jgi:hypothetical protein